MNVENIGAAMDDVAVMPATNEDMERIRDGIERDCARRGTSAAMRDLIEGPFMRWMDAMGDARTEHGALDRADMMTIAAAMDRTLAVRDALIVSIILGEEDAPREFLLDFIARPMLPRNARRLEDLLGKSFRDAARRPGKARCDQGIDMLFDIIGVVPERYQVQPLAVIAYVLWWMGDERAMLCALRALALDEGCSLAAIVCSALHRHVGPAWTVEI